MRIAGFGLSLLLGAFIPSSDGNRYVPEGVAAHREGNARAKPKKMGVKSLRVRKPEDLAECRLCQGCHSWTVTLWFMAWTPYFIFNWGGMFNKPMVTPLFSILGLRLRQGQTPSTTPIVYGHQPPQVRAALREVPCLSLRLLRAEMVVLMWIHYHCSTKPEKTESA
ncbi:rhodopsin-like [Penaeus chinensis]|uniref:rhodopsin-like n=1 Tax=Penaeus chinensis TaxID=139456 RepID=UPI001FB71910|nr:rhodopsin-like [Penaeus chinensis]